MKAKTKRRIKHVLIQKKLVKKSLSRKLVRSAFILTAALSTGSLAYAIAVTKPTVGIAVHSTGPDGRLIQAPATPEPKAVPFFTDTGDGLSGRASWYALGLPEPDSLTCASRTFPRGSYLRVTSQRNGKSVVCRVNDYGPAVWTGRVIDLSRGSFNQLDSLGTGTIPVRLQPVAKP